MSWICTRCIKKEHEAGKSMVTVPEHVLGTCSYCDVENWVFEVVGDVPAQTVGDMPELGVEKPKKRKKREVSESIPEENIGVSNVSSEDVDLVDGKLVIPVEKSAVEETLDIMEDEHYDDLTPDLSKAARAKEIKALKAQLAEVEK